MVMVDSDSKQNPSGGIISHSGRLITTVEIGELISREFETANPTKDFETATSEGI